VTRLLQIAAVIVASLAALVLLASLGGVTALTGIGLVCVVLALYIGSLLV